MSLIKPQNLEEEIIRLLSHQKRSTIDLLSHIQKSQYTVTKQGFYKALRRLKKEEVILIYKKIVSLDTVWIRRMSAFVEETTRAYEVTRDSFDILWLEDKQSLTYSFSTIQNLDNFWGNFQSILVNKTHHKEPVFSYDPHYWFFISRRERELELLKEMVEQKRQFLMTVGGTLPLDKIVKKDFNNDYLQYNYKTILEGNNQYMTVIGDYIAEVTLDSAVSDKIDTIYKNETSASADVTARLTALLDTRGKNKIKISRNTKKAEMLKKRFQRDFYVLR